MFNTKRPTSNELPTSRQLIRSTIIALSVAAALTVTVVMPSEYAIDPTGIGRLLGLTEMGEIKATLATESAADQKAKAAKAVTPTAPVAVDEPKKVKIAVQQHEMNITLQPNQSAEVKLEMKKGTQVDYAWATNSGVVNYDTHGDSPKISYHGYGKGLGKPEDKGVLVAAFDGKHGWFWRNRSKKAVTLNLRTSGDYLSIKRLF
jgi:hypothetical protein